MSRRKGIFATAKFAEGVQVASRRSVISMSWLVVEPSAALGIAAILEDRERFSGRHIVTFVCGSNVDMDAYHHWGLPLRTDTDVDPLTRYQQRAGAFVSVNAGYSPHSFRDAKTLLRHYRAAIIAHPALDLAATVDDVEAITRRGGWWAAAPDDWDTLDAVTRNALRAHRLANE